MRQIEDISLRQGWMQRLASAGAGRWTYPTFGLISALESSVLPVPIDLAMTPLGLANPRKIWLLVIVGTLGSLVGALAGYAIGALAMDLVGWKLLDAYGLRQAFLDMSERYLDMGWQAIFVAGLTPIPFKVAAIMSGAVKMSLAQFVIATLLVRLVRFSLMGAVIRLFGAGLRVVLERHGGKFTIVAVAVTAAALFLTPIFL